MALREVDELKGDFVRSMVRAMTVSGLIIAVPGVTISVLLNGKSGLWGALAGFAVAFLHSLALVLLLRWALSKPLRMLPSLLMVSYFVRLLALVGILFGLTYVDALDTITMLACFILTYLVHTGIEFFYGWKSTKASLEE